MQYNSMMFFEFFLLLSELNLATVYVSVKSFIKSILWISKTVCYTGSYLQSSKAIFHYCLCHQKMSNEPCLYWGNISNINTSPKISQRGMDNHRRKLGINYVG